MMFQGRVFSNSAIWVQNALVKYGNFSQENITEYTNEYATMSTQDHPKKTHSLSMPRDSTASIHHDAKQLKKLAKNTKYAPIKRDLGVIQSRNDMEKKRKIESIGERRSQYDELFHQQEQHILPGIAGVGAKDLYY